MNKDRMILRTRFIERASHWLMVLCFFSVALSGLSWFFPSLNGLNAVFGTPQMARILHPFFGVVVFLLLVFLFIRFVRYNLPEAEDRLWFRNVPQVLAGKHEPQLQIGKYNAGQKVLFWGIMGVLVLRAIMIGLGAALIHEFAWILYVFGAFLFFTGIKMLFAKLDDAPDLENNVLVKFLRKHLRVTDELHGQRFFVRQDDGQGRSVLWVTPLFLALILIECADLVFAIDSVPAIFAITQDPFIVYTSNIFAILGLRALYFALAALIHRFAYLKYALALVLVFIGAKIFLVGIIGKIPAVVSLSVTLVLLVGGVLLSLYKTRGQPLAKI